MVLLQSILNSSSEHADFVNEHEDLLLSRSEKTSTKPASESQVMFKSPVYSKRHDNCDTTLATEDKKKKSVERAVIEISPGFRQPLRLALETEAAMRKGFVRETSCQFCNLTMLCIRDARFVLCPTCRSISPLNDDEDEQSNDTFGVGLGVLKPRKSRLRQRVSSMA